MSGVHDNEILSYVVDLENHYITMYTRYLDYDLQVNQETTIEFQNVSAHFFEDVLSGSIICDIDECDIEDFVAENAQVLEEKRDYCFPISYDTKKELIEKLKDMNQKCFTISSSLGFNGWILAEDMKITTESIDFESILNKHILVGITYKDSNDNILKQIQFHGTIISSDKTEGIVIRREDTKEDFNLPPDLTSTRKAKPGEYELASTGEIVVNPDLLSTWIVIQNEKEGKIE